MGTSKRESARQVFGRNLRQVRLDKDLTQEELSHATGLRQSYISEIEAGKRNVSIDNIEALAKAMKVSLAQLFEEN
jgi:transcriptional regulator with XRE-family HTH domain